MSDPFKKVIDKPIFPEIIKQARAEAKRRRWQKFHDGYFRCYMHADVLQDLSKKIGHRMLKADRENVLWGFRLIPTDESTPRMNLFSRYRADFGNDTHYNMFFACHRSWLSDQWYCTYFLGALSPESDPEEVKYLAPYNQSSTHFKRKYSYGMGATKHPMVGSSYSILSPQWNADIVTGMAICLAPLTIGRCGLLDGHPGECLAVDSPECEI